MGTENTVQADCDMCNGDKEIKCIQCYGSGKHGSDPDKPCPHCQGNKVIVCPGCRGTGKK
jgi:hypothetical protein